MSVRTVIELSIAAGFDASVEDTLFERDFSQTDDTLDHGTSYTRTLEAEELVDIDFGGITEIRLVYIEADGEVTIGLGAQTFLDLKRPIDPASATAGEKKAIFCGHVSPSELTITNPSTTAAVKIRVLLVGDLVAD